jgi:hypothetical protein
MLAEFINILLKECDDSEFSSHIDSLAELHYRIGITAFAYNPFGEVSSNDKLSQIVE